MTRCEWNYHHRCRATIAARLVQKWSATLGKAAKNSVRFSDLNTPYHLFIDESQLDHVFASPRHYVGEFLLESAGQAGLYRLCYCHWQALVRARLNLIGQIDISSSTSELSILYWLVLWNMFYVSQSLGWWSNLTNSIIFQRGRAQPPTSYKCRIYNDQSYGKEIHTGL